VVVVVEWILEGKCGEGFWKKKGYERKMGSFEV
jgi:hypothetical protein